jgi:hypothetical protein
MSAADGLFFWDYDDLDRAKRDALKTIIDHYEKPSSERAEIFYFLDALDYLHDDLLAGVKARRTRTGGGEP